MGMSLIRPRHVLSIGLWKGTTLRNIDTSGDSAFVHCKMGNAFRIDFGAGFA
jgi:hypothetical protein